VFEAAVTSVVTVHVAEHDATMLHSEFVGLRCVK
jgi:hypothetical protein